MTTQTFKSTLLQTGGTTTGIEVPAEVLAALGGCRKPRVAVTVNGFAYSTSVGAMGGRSLVPVSAERRTAAGLKGGDPIEVTLELDTAPGEVEVPADFALALAGDAAALAAFNALAPSHRLAHVAAIAGAKAADTRARRIEKALATLRPATA